MQMIGESSRYKVPLIRLFVWVVTLSCLSPELSEERVTQL